MGGEDARAARDGRIGPDDAGADGRGPALGGRLDAGAFASLYRESYGALRLVASAQVGRVDADDVLQHAAIVALERLERFEPGTDFRAWMAAIVRGVARNHRRAGVRRDRRHRELRERAGGSGDGLGNGAGAVASDGRVVPNPRVVRGAEGVGVEFPEGFDERLRNAVEALGPLQAACLLLKSVHGHSYDEIGGMLDMPAATARSHVFRARARLLEVMTPGGVDDA